MWTCPKCGKAYGKVNQYHICESADLNTLFKGNQDLINLYQQFLEKTEKKLGHFYIKHSKKSIVWSTKVAFAIIQPKKDSFDVKILLSKDYDGVFPIYKTRQWTQKKFNNWVRLYEAEDIDKTVLSLMQEAIDLSRK